MSEKLLIELKNSESKPLTRSTSLPPEKRRMAMPRTSENDQWPLFRHFYTSGVLPIKIDYGPPGSPPKNLKWIHSERELSEETIRLMLPKFALGLPLVDQPYRFVAERGFVDLLNFTKNSRPIIANLVQIVRALRAALYSFDHAKKRETLRILVKLSRIQGVGPALVPFYRQLLPPLRVVSHVSSLAGKIVSIDRDLERDIETALNELERSGGPNAYTNIKYVLPTYESCLGV